jgi:hypothetical protein
MGGWVDPGVGLDDVKKRKFLTLPGLELRPLGRPTRGQSLYRLRYPGFLGLSRKIPKMDHECFLPNSLQFMNHVKQILTMSSNVPQETRLSRSGIHKGKVLGFEVLTAMVMKSYFYLLGRNAV